MAPPRGPRLPVAERLLARIEAEPMSGCWLWTGSAGKSGGNTLYGMLMVWVDGVRRNRQAHRVAYETFKGPIPDGLQLDHLCRTTLCVNPAHLEPVTPRENYLRGVSPPANNARKTHCSKGHAFDENNTVHTTAGRRYCRTCRSAWYRAMRAKRRVNGLYGPELEEE